VLKFACKYPGSPKKTKPLTYEFGGHQQICRGEKYKSRDFEFLTLQPIETKFYHFQNVPDFPYLKKIGSNFLI